MVVRTNVDEEGWGVSEWFDIRQGNPLKRKLRDGELVLGSFVRIPASEAVEVCGHCGFDCVVIDTEHTPVDAQVPAALVRAAEACGVPPLVRLHDSQPENIARMLETGAVGLHVPQIRSASHAETVVTAALYPPLGSRGLATNRLSGYGLRGPLTDFVSAMNQELVMVLQVESAEALAEIEAIASTPSCDVIFIGLTDLSIDLGITADYGHPRLRQALARAKQAADGAGIALGAPAASLQMAGELIAQGVTYITSNDIRLLSNAGREFVSSLRSPPP